MIPLRKNALFRRVQERIAAKRSANEDRVDGKTPHPQGRSRFHSIGLKLVHGAHSARPSLRVHW